ncbi:uncharacterized protein [Blastocystis hominis]|uniref:Uncharacterized protein n=1 Tax=Blastocystis hominis TaxID=12968 RepID=D8LZL4_BLAHO|nr:uncharacterized protein [Blastocystis hominis]CBK21253.2 unnamed protein product [Blastocystis hominis]|eukprot:XP_012895301.1 uncharacterized protein [Blastocystis hominis]
MSKVKPEDCIAIDFGTSNTAVYVYKDKKFDNPVCTADTNYCIPSVAVIDKSGITVSDKVIKSQPSKGYIYSVKRILGKNKHQFEESEIGEEVFHSPLNFDDPQNPYFEVSYGAGNLAGSRNVYPIEVATEILKKCKEVAETRLDSHLDVRNCVMTIPNNFFDTSKKVLREAAKRAGLNVLYFLKEPTAAGICCLEDKEKIKNEKGEKVIDLGIKEGEMVMVFDFGGGTLDLTLMVRNGDDFDVKAQGGDPSLGGDKIDEIFCKYVLQIYQNKNGEELLGDNVGSKRYKKKYTKLLDLCREGKEQLSASVKFDIPLGDFNVEHDDMLITVEEFNGNVMKIIQSRIDTALENDIFKRNIDQIKHVILVGGSSKIPFIHNYIRQWIPNAKVHRSHSPHTVVVEGAMRHLVNEYNVEEVFEDSLGFEVNKEMSEHFYPGIRLPCSTIRYFTFYNNRDDNKIKVHRKVNGKWRIEGVIDLQAAYEMGIRTGQTVQIRVTCTNDTSVTYTVLGRGRKAIGTLDLSLVFSVCSNPLKMVYTNC